MKRTVSFTKNAANIFFHILTRCNLTCRHCYINPSQHGDAVLPIETIRKWLSIFKEKAPSANVIFLGGEPTLHPDLAPAVKAARAFGYASITIDTNGYLFHGILEKVTPEDVDYFSFSLDGPTAGVNDPIRGKGSFSRCTDGIKRAVAAGFDVSVIYTVSRKNVKHLLEMPPLLSALGVNRFFIQVIGIRGRSANKCGEALQLTREEWAATVPAAAQKAASLGIPTIYPKVFLDRNEPFECAGEAADNYFIFPNGRVYRCPLCEDYPFHSLRIVNDRLEKTPKINEADLFALHVPEGCPINQIVQPDNLVYDERGRPLYRIACCMLKEEVSP